MPDLPALPHVSSESDVELEITIQAHKEGVRVYDGGKFVGKSPVVVRKVLVVRHLEGGVKRYFVEGREVHPGEDWPLYLETFKQGVRTSMKAFVPFDPEVRQHTVTLK